MSDPRLTEHALKLLRHDPIMMQDARRFTRTNNTVAGGVMSMTLDIPRWVAEEAVADAIRTIDTQARFKTHKKGSK